MRAIPDSGARTASQDGDAADRLEKIAARLEQEVSVALAANTSEPSTGILTRILGASTNPPAVEKVASVTTAPPAGEFKDTTLQSILSDVLRGGQPEEANRSGVADAAETGMPKTATVAALRAALGSRT